MNNFVQLQEDLWRALLANSVLQNVNVVQWRKLRLQSEVDISSIWLTPRNGRSGAGIVVEMPTFEVPHPNLPGPEAFLNCPFSIVEEPNLNFAPQAGTLLSAEEIAQHVLQILHDFQIEGLATIYAGQNAITPTEDFPDVLSYRVTLRMRLPRSQTARVATPVLEESAGLVTITCATADASIFYTLDESFPGAGNPAAQPYTAPVPVAVGQIIRAAAYTDTAPGSHVTRQTVT